MLSARRKAWAAQRGGARFRGKVLAYPAGIMSRYQVALVELVRQMTAETKREVDRLFASEVAAGHFAQDAGSISSQARILTNRLDAQFRRLFAQQAPKLADEMATAASNTSHRALASSLKELSGGATIKTANMPGTLSDLIKAAVAENVNLIKTIQAGYFAKVRTAISATILGENPEHNLAETLQQMQGQTERRAQLLALDQTRKVYTAINTKRMQAAGIKKFEWIHSGGGNEPREDHEEMDGKVYDFANPPIIDKRTGERGLPGDAINCRCTMRPIFDFELGGDDAADGDN